MTSILDNAQWFKSSYTYQNGQCVEVAPNLPRVVAIRDSKNPTGPVLVIPRAAFRSLLTQRP